MGTDLPDCIHDGLSRPDITRFEGDLYIRKINVFSFSSKRRSMSRLYDILAGLRFAPSARLAPRTEENVVSDEKTLASIDPEIAALEREMYGSKAGMEEKKTADRLTPDQISTLLSLQYTSTKDTILKDDRGSTQKDRTIVYEVVGLILVSGYDETVKYLTTVTDREMLYWELPTLRQAKLWKVSERQMLKGDREKGRAGPPCEKCKSTDTEYRIKKVRSSDEPEVVFYSCYACEHRWTSG